MLEQVIGQVHTPDPVVDNLDVRSVLLDCDMPDYLGAEPIVAQEDIADSAHQDSHWNRTVR